MGSKPGRKTNRKFLGSDLGRTLKCVMWLLLPEPRSWDSIKGTSAIRFSIEETKRLILNLDEAFSETPDTIDNVLKCRIDHGLRPEYESEHPDKNQDTVKFMGPAKLIIERNIPISVWDMLKTEPVLSNNEQIVKPQPSFEGDSEKTFCDKIVERVKHPERYLIIALFNDGTIKIGISDDPKERLQDYVSRKLNDVIKKSIFNFLEDGMAWTCEQHILNAFSYARIKHPITNRNTEYLSNETPSETVFAFVRWLMRIVVAKEIL